MSELEIERIILRHGGQVSRSGLLYDTIMNWFDDFKEQKDAGQRWVELSPVVTFDSVNVSEVMQEINASTQQHGMSIAWKQDTHHFWLRWG